MERSVAEALKLFKEAWRHAVELLGYKMEAHGEGSGVDRDVTNSTKQEGSQTLLTKTGY
jgi:hypothetical protein